jgi:hypothetical protein
MTTETDGNSMKNLPVVGITMPSTTRKRKTAREKVNARIGTQELSKTDFAAKDDTSP